jgi:HEAT repeat protein
LLGTAHAQAAGDVADKPKIEDVLADLASDDTAVRRTARDLLVSFGADAVRPMFDALRGSTPDTLYRVRLGVFYALAGMLRKNPSSDTAIAAAMTDDDIRQLAAGAADEDKTTRVYATEALYLLKDPRAAEPLVGVAQSHPDPNGVYNSVLALKGVYPQLSPDQQSRVMQRLQSAIPRENAKTRSRVDSLPSR